MSNTWGFDQSGWQNLITLAGKALDCSDVYSEFQLIRLSNIQYSFSRSRGRFSNQLPVSQRQWHSIDLKLRLRAKSKFQYEDTLQHILSPQRSEILNTIVPWESLTSKTRKEWDVGGHIDGDSRFRAWGYDLGEVVALGLLARTCVTLHFTVWAVYPPLGRVSRRM